MAYGKLLAGGVTVGILGAGAAAVMKARRDRERRRKANTPPVEPTVPGAVVEWKRGSYIGRITKGEANDWLVEIRPAAEGGIAQVAMIEPSYQLAAELVRNWVDGLSGKTPKAPASVGDMVVFGRSGGLHTAVIARRGDGGFAWILALSSEVTAAIAAGPALWATILDTGKFIASGETSTYPEAVTQVAGAVASA